MASKGLKMQLGVLSQGRWTGEWTSPTSEHVASTLHGLREPSRYWVVSDAQLKRDLQGRTLVDVYRDNRAGSTTTRFTPYRPRTLNDSSVAYCGGREPYGHGANANRRKTHPVPLTLAEEYAAWCKDRGHTPHPASVDPSHPVNAFRERCPRRETVQDDMQVAE